MPKPILLALDGDERDLQRLELELTKRYATDYRVVAERSPANAIRTLEDHAAAGGDAALLVTALWLPDTTGVEVLARAHALFPHAKRLLVIRWGDRAAATPILRATALNQIDTYTGKPIGESAEGFHKVVTDLLADWSSLTQPQMEAVSVVGDAWSSRSHELRDLLRRNGVSYRYYDVNTEEGQVRLERIGCPRGPLPVVALFDGTVLSDPTNEELADAFGVNTRPSNEPYDLAIVGGGPAGLSAAVYAASEGLRTLVIEGRAIGGQAGTTSLIRNYLGFPDGIGGGQLAVRAHEQAWRLGAKFYFMRRATRLRAQGQNRIVTLSDGTEIASRSVVLSMGVEYRRLGMEGLDSLLGAGVYYGAAVTEARAMAGQEVFVVGAGNSAGQAALHLARYASRVTLLVRGESLYTSMSEYLIHEITARPNITVRVRTEVVGGCGVGRLRGLVLRDADSGNQESVPAFALFVLIGAIPHTTWLPPEVVRDDRGFVVTGNHLTSYAPASSFAPNARAPLPFETSVPGVFAIGDSRHGSVKRVASAVGEGSVAVQQVHTYLADHA